MEVGDLGGDNRHACCQVLERLQGKGGACHCAVEKRDDAHGRLLQQRRKLLMGDGWVDLTVSDGAALAIAYTALHRDEYDPEWPRMLRTFNAHFPGLRREFEAHRNAELIPKAEKG